MAFLKKRETGNWYLVDKSDGKAKWIKLGSISKAEANTVLSRYNTDQTYLKLDLQSDSKISFKECAKEYLAWAFTIKRNETMRGEKNIANLFIKSFGEQPLCSIQISDYERSWIGRSPNTIRLRIALLRSLYQYAISRKYLHNNIAKNLKRPRIPILPPKHTDMETLKKLFSVMNYHIKQKFMILLYTGMRPSEMLRLQVKDIDLKSKKIIVRLTKTDRFRVLPMHQNIVPAFEYLLKGKKQEDYLFPNKNGGHQISLRRGLETACKHAGVKITSYQFRHTFATLILDKKNNLRTVQQLLGHASIQMTTRYATTLDQRLQEAVDSI